MRQIEQLILQYCPNGVPWVKLGEVLNYQQPGPYIVESTEYNNMYSTPVLTAGQSFILGYTNEKTGIYKASVDNPVIIFDDFTTSFHWVNFDFKVKSSAMKMLKSKNADTSFRYVYYAMCCIQFIPTEHTRHWISIYSQFSIPLPPLPVQEAIVEVLDTMTETIDTIDTLISLRKQQFEYYREKLLTFGEEVPWVKLGEVFELRNGYTPSKSNVAFWEGGTIPWFRMEDIRANGHILSDSIQHITPAAVKGKGLFKAGSFILATTATIGEHALLIADSLANQRFTNLKIRKSLEKHLITKFVYYYFDIIDAFCKEHTNVSGFASVDMEALKNMLLPLPSLEVQQSIVEKLDTMEEFIHTLEHLRALRQKQYEYYREKLLTFDK